MSVIAGKLGPALVVPCRVQHGSELHTFAVVNCFPTWCEFETYPSFVWFSIPYRAPQPGTRSFNPLLHISHWNVVEWLSVTCNIVGQSELFVLALCICFLGNVSGVFKQSMKQIVGQMWLFCIVRASPRVCPQPYIFCFLRPKCAGRAASVKTQLASFPFENSKLSDERQKRQTLFSPDGETVWPNLKENPETLLSDLTTWIFKQAGNAFWRQYHIAYVNY